MEGGISPAAHGLGPDRGAAAGTSPISGDVISEPGSVSFARSATTYHSPPVVKPLQSLCRPSVFHVKLWQAFLPVEPKLRHTKGSAVIQPIPWQAHGSYDFMAPLVDYSDSDSAPEEPQPDAKRRKLDQDASASSVPALPASFYSLYATNVRAATSDDPSLHGGRTRQVAHQQGKWPTHIYLEWYPAEREESDIGTVISAARSVVPETHSFLRSNLDVQLPLHISLSAPLVLETDQKETFTQTVKDAIGDAGARSFSVGLRAVDWVPNFDKTRFFLVLKLTRPANDDLNKLLSACNTSARNSQLPELYHKPSTEPHAKLNDKDDCFHISIAWTLHEPTAQARQMLQQITPAQLEQTAVWFTVVKLKIGNVVHDVELPAAAEA